MENNIYSFTIPKLSNLGPRLAYILTISAESRACLNRRDGLNAVIYGLEMIRVGKTMEGLSVVTEGSHVIYENLLKGFDCHGKPMPRLREEDEEE